MATTAPTDVSLPGFTGVYSFGDSLVDPGNALRGAELVASFPFIGLPDAAPVASAGYFDGRFTDGYNFADLISNKMLLFPTRPTFPYGFEDPVFGLPLPFATRPEGPNLSFAYGGAQAVQGEEEVPDLDDQTDAYRDYPSADPDALYIVTIGGNDVRALAPETGATASAATATTRMTAAASAIAEEVGQLFQFGARHVLVTGIPDIGLLPIYTGAADEAQRRSLASQYSEQADTLLTARLANLTVPAGGELLRASISDFSDRLIADPERYGLTDLTRARLLVQPEPLGQPGSGFLFFDRVHPSAQVHALFAASILNSLRPSDQRLDLAAPAALRLTSTLETSGDADDFHVSLVAGRTYVFDLLGVSVGAADLADPRLLLLDSGAVLASDDDSGIGLDAHLAFVAPHTGDFVLRAAGVGVTSGSYQLQARQQSGPDLLATGGLRGSDETVIGGGSADTIAAESGANSLAGSDGADALTGGAGTDSLNGNQGHDLVRGGPGADAVYGGRDNDSLSGDDGDDFVSGDLGNDTVNGNAGADILAGGAGADTLRGGQGADLLTGGDGNDWIAGDRGDDTMAGGAGADLFYAFAGSAVDRISDFDRAAGDRVGLAVGTQYAVNQTGADVTVALSSGDQVILAGVQQSTLGDGWIVFVA